jgi:hypothetical protein
MFFLADITMFTNDDDISVFRAKVYVLLDEENQDAVIRTV